MDISISETKNELGEKAAMHGAKYIREAIADKGYANIIVATGASQFEMLENLVKEPNIDWSVVTMFHLDEYVDLPETHPASFRKYLKERFEQQLPSPLKAAYYVNGEGNVEENLAELNAIIEDHPIDLCFAGIGENGHLAFNDPPANFDTEVPYLVVDLDEDCRKQQLGEGWFPNLEAVPAQAISMSIKQIMKSGVLIISVPDERKAQAVKNTVEQEVSNLFPASIMQNHDACYLYLDQPSASKLG
ncbi:MAG: glucosamine-6-phosphate deaminase [Lentisphaeria bacterium]|nr:glucosamine-6-phosphate deaminase [Lentisphaeria bacterium]